MELYLVRHAVATSRGDPAWQVDRDRPLTPEGEERFRKVARGLARLVASVDSVLASPYVRAWRTAEILHEESGWPAPEPCPELEASRDAAAAMDVVRDQRDSSSVALVGHEPNLSELASLLLTGSASKVAIDLKKGGLIALWADGNSKAGSAALRWVLTPKVLRCLAR